MEWNGNRISKFRGKKLRENEMCRFGHDFLRSRNDRLDKDNNTEIEIVNFLLFSPSIKILEDRDPRRFYLFVRDSVRVMLIIEAQRRTETFLFSALLFMENSLARSDSCVK